MRRTILAVAALLISAMPALAGTRTVMVVDDVIRMSKAGVTDENIIAFVKKSDEPFDVSGDDVIAMNDAHVSADVIKAVIDESAARMKEERRVADSDRRERTSDRRTTVYVNPGVYSPWYDPFYYGYDPFWYRPRVFVGFTFGRFHGGHFRHH
jgi:hypothetical protein